jgi:hypothetical protein
MLIDSSQWGKSDITCLKEIKHYFIKVIVEKPMSASVLCTGCKVTFHRKFINSVLGFTGYFVIFIKLVPNTTFYYSIEYQTLEYVQKPYIYIYIY